MAAFYYRICAIQETLIVREDLSIRSLPHASFPTIAGSSRSGLTKQKEEAQAFLKEKLRFDPFVDNSCRTDGDGDAPEVETGRLRDP